MADPAIAMLSETFVPLHKTLCIARDALDDEVRLMARESELACRLMTVPGVGPIVALAYIATLDDEKRFRKSIDVGAFLGLTPKRHQSARWIGRARYPNAVILICADYYTQRRRH